MTSHIETNGTGVDHNYLHLVEPDESGIEERGVVRFLQSKHREGWHTELEEAREHLDRGAAPTIQDTYSVDNSGLLAQYADALVKVTVVPKILNTKAGMFTPDGVDKWLEVYENNVVSPFKNNEYGPLTPQQRLNEEVRIATVSVAGRLLTQLHQEGRIAQVNEKLGVAPIKQP